MVGEKVDQIESGIMIGSHSCGGGSVGSVLHDHLAIDPAVSRISLAAFSKEGLAGRWTLMVFEGCPERHITIEHSPFEFGYKVGIGIPSSVLNNRAVRRSPRGCALFHS